MGKRKRAESDMVNRIFKKLVKRRKIIISSSSSSEDSSNQYSLLSPTTEAIAGDREIGG